MSSWLIENVDHVVDKSERKEKIQRLNKQLDNQTKLDNQTTLKKSFLVVKKVKSI